MDPSKLIVPAIAAAIIALLALKSSPAPPIGDIPPVETKHEYPLYRDDKGADAEVVASGPAGGELGRWLLDDGQLFGPVDRDGRKLEGDALAHVNATIVLTERVYDPFWAPGGFERLDLGTFAGYRGGSDAAGERFETGLRYSPVRTLWGTLAPDLVVGRYSAGIGASFYPPRQLGRFWRHWGVGIWETAPYEGTGIGWCAGLTFSTLGR